MIQKNQNILSLLADLLEYPSGRTAEQARAAAAALGRTDQAAERHLDEFLKFSAERISCLEELYTDSFDLEAACPPYVGHHLFGEDRVRGMFLVRLKQQYGGRIVCGNELPDHIALVLRCMSSDVPSDEIRDLRDLCLIPAVKKMIPLLKDPANPYRGVLQAVLCALENDAGGRAS